MGPNNLTICGNRYLTIFTNKRTRVMWPFLHRDKTGSTIVALMKKAHVKFGYWPLWMQSDGATEYCSPEVEALFAQHNIDHRISNAEQQHQNAAVETLVNVIGRGVRVLLLFSGMAPEFWGLAALHVATVYNFLQHASLNFQIPYFLKTGRMPDISWLRVWGCSAVVHRGKELVDHSKAAPLGESGVCVGLGLVHGRKSWLVYSASTNTVYSSTDCTFDEAFFPAREHDQRWYCYYDNIPTEEFRADMHA
eukprot:2540469-Rhodomonas_salina.1